MVEILSEYNIICINHEVYKISLYDFIKSGTFKAIPSITYNVNFSNDNDKESNTKVIYSKIPFEILKKDNSFSKFKGVLGRDEKNIEFLQIPGESYKKILLYIGKNMSKVIADYISSLIVRLIEELYIIDKNKKNIFIINNTSDDKLIGRIAYMYLCSKKNTFALISFMPSDLMTNKTSYEGKNNKFDIKYFEDDEGNNICTDRSKIIPNDSMDSLTQTFFYNVEKDNEFSPIRVDLFSQGLSKNEIEEKSNQIIEVLKDVNQTGPYENKQIGDFHTRLPIGLLDCIAYHNNRLKKDIEELFGKG